MYLGITVHITNRWICSLNFITINKNCSITQWGRQYGEWRTNSHMELYESAPSRQLLVSYYGFFELRSITRMSCHCFPSAISSGRITNRFWLLSTYASTCSHVYTQHKKIRNPKLCIHVWAHAVLPQLTSAISTVSYTMCKTHFFSRQVKTRNCSFSYFFLSLSWYTFTLINVYALSVVEKTDLNITRHRNKCLYVTDISIVYKDFAINEYEIGNISRSWQESPFPSSVTAATFITLAPFSVVSAELNAPG